MITGNRALMQINSALSKLREEENTLRRESDQASSDLVKTREQIAQVARDLAAFRLESGQQSVAEGYIDARAKTVATLISTREETYKQAAREVETAGTQLTELTTTREHLSTRLSDQEQAFETALSRIEDDATDPDYLAARETVLEIEAKLERAVAKTEQSEKDRVEKGKAYESDPLFMYLWRRDFGTNKYDSWGLIRTLDKWVAKLCQFHKARPNYVMLNQIPARLADHVEQLEDTLQAADEELSAAERQAVRRRLGDDKGAEITELEIQIQDLDNQIENLEAKFDAAETTAANISTGQDAEYTQATTLLAEIIEGEDTRKLWDDAFKTPERTDDELVQHLERLRREVRSLQDQQTDAARRLTKVEDRRKELQQVASDFRRSGYDRPGTTFSDDSIGGALLESLLKGALSSGGYRDRLRSTVRRAPRRRQRDPIVFSGGGFSGRSSGGRSSGGFGGGGGFRTGGGFGGRGSGGGFKTGGGF